MYNKREKEIIKLQLKVILTAKELYKVTTSPITKEYLNRLIDNEVYDIKDYYNLDSAIREYLIEINKELITCLKYRGEWDEIFDYTDAVCEFLEFRKKFKNWYCVGEVE